MKVEEFEEKVLELEESVFHLDIIESFAYRGWALYPLCSLETPIQLTSFLDLKPIVELGREKERLDYDKRYILLPLNSQDSNWAIIRDLSFMLLSQGRGPFFVEFEEGIDEGGKWVSPVGRFLIDSVYLSPPELVLIIEPNLSTSRKPELLKLTEIRIHLSELWKIRKQLMLALRKI